jgi:hypothetical protein
MTVRALPWFLRSRAFINLMFDQRQSVLCADRALTADAQSGY